MHPDCQTLFERQTTYAQIVHPAGYIGDHGKYTRQQEQKMTESPATQPFVDDAVLARLREDLQPDTGICDGFINNYMGLLPARRSRINQTVESMDAEAALDAVLSLKTSSLMVGASRLGIIARNLESTLRLSANKPRPDSDPLPTACRPLLESIQDCTAGTLTRLAAHAAA